MVFEDFLKSRGNILISLKGINLGVSCKVYYCIQDLMFWYFYGVFFVIYINFVFVMKFYKIINCCFVKYFLGVYNGVKVDEVVCGFVFYYYYKFDLWFLM